MSGKDALPPKPDVPVAADPPYFAIPNSPLNQPLGLLTKSLLRGDALEMMRSIVGPQNALRPRRIITANGSRTRGKFASIRFRKVLPWESNPERAFIHQIQFSEIVAEVYSQPAKLRLRTSEGEIFYTPDFLVITQSHELVCVDCKIAEDLRKPDVAARLTRVEVALARVGIRFVTPSDNELTKDPLYRNVMRLIPHILDSVNQAAVLAALRERILPLCPLPFHELAKATDSRMALRAIANRIVFTNMHLELGANSPISAEHRRSDDVASYL